MVRRFLLPVSCLHAGLAIILLVGCGGSDPFTSSFNWEVSPDRREIQPGGQAVYNITLRSKVNINSTVALRVEGVPENATASFDNANLPETANTATLTIQTTAGTPIGTYTLRVFAQEAGQPEQQINVSLVVVETPGIPDFSLEVEPATHSFTDFQSGKTFTYFVRPLNGFQGTVTTTVTGLSDDLQMTQGPTPAQVDIGGTTGGAGGTFVIRAVPNPPITSPVDITVRSTSGNTTHTRTIRILIILG